MGLVLAVTLAIMANSVARAQVVTGQITGRVIDPSAAVVPDVQVDVVNEDNGLRRRVATNSDGYYTIPLLPPGSYDVSVRKGASALLLAPESI